MSAQGGSRALLILDLQDQFAVARGFSGAFPPILGGVRFQLVAQTNQMTNASVPLPQPLEMKVIRNPSGLFLFFGRVVTADGLVRAVDPQGWPWTIRILSDFYQTVEQPVAAPSDSLIAGPVVPVVLAPGAVYPFPNEPSGTSSARLRGTLRNPDGSAVSGAQVEALDANNRPVAGPARTGEDGQWVLIFAQMPARSVTVQFTYTDGTIRLASNVAVVAGRENNENSLPQTALRGQVRLRKVGIANAVIQVQQIRGEQALTDSTGNWFFYFVPDNAGGSVTVTATLPDRSATKSSATIVKPRATVVVTTFDF